jgi:type IV pilus assembly protein PilE
MRVPGPARGFTLVELLTVAVVVIVLGAIAVPMYRSHLLRVRRADASAALVAIQGAQDRHFGRGARYAEGDQLTLEAPGGLGLKNASERGYYALELKTSADGLGYLATARASDTSGQDADTRCARMTIDHNGQRRAYDAHGADRTADCWR